MASESGATEKSEKEREELAKTVGRFLQKDAPPAERLAAEQLAKLLAKDAEKAVRIALAEEVRNCQFLPHDLTVKIANDILEISSPFLLQENKALNDEALEALARDCNEEAREVIATRAGLPEPVSAVISEIGKEKAVSNLMENKTAQMSDRVFNNVAKRFADNKKVMDKMASRSDLNLKVIDQIIDKISTEAANLLSANYEIKPEYAIYLSGEAKSRAMSQTLDSASDQEMDVYFRGLYDQGKLNDSMLLQILQKGKLRQFAVAASIRSFTRIEQVHKTLKEGKRETVMRLFEKMKVGRGLDVVLFDAYLSALKSNPL